MSRTIRRGDRFRWESEGRESRLCPTVGTVVAYEVTSIGKDEVRFREVWSCCGKTHTVGVTGTTVPPRRAPRVEFEQGALRLSRYSHRVVEIEWEIA